jgi:hypothetical protein
VFLLVQDAGRREKELLREELILKAEMEGCEAKLLCKEPEILRVAAAMHRSMTGLNESQQLVLKEARKTGWLSYRPSGSKLRRVSDQRWCKRFPEGNYKLDVTYWGLRYRGLDSTGRPQLHDGMNPTLPLTAQDLQLDCFEGAAPEAVVLFDFVFDVFVCVCFVFFLVVVGRAVGLINSLINELACPV